MMDISSFGWHHDFEIVPGVRTNGTYDPSALLRALRLPSDLSGVRVADVGASNGFFSFALESRGADVTAFDYRHEDNSGFGLARHLNGSKITHIHANIYEISPASHGMFDIVLGLGLVYHTSDPYHCLHNLASICSRLLLVESYCDPLLPPMTARFLPDPERFPGMSQPNSDRSNFWVFSPETLPAVLRDIGFDPVRVEPRGDRVLVEAVRKSDNPRKELAYDRMPRVPVGADKSNLSSWRIF